MDSPRKASEIVALLDLKPHPDGATSPLQGVSSCEQCNLLLAAIRGIAHLHRIPCAETWHFYLGEPLTVFELYNDGRIKLTVVGPDLEAGHRPQYTVPPDVWFGAFPTLDVESYSADGSVLVKAPKRDPELHYSFVGVTCAPAFQYDDNELATRAELKNLAPSAEPFLNYLIP
uniref:DUF985 domain-containing protein n=1 Tax=Ananas comosus var. bracteatus TaxID=296719 RepID=A0A6V7P8X2_ANACO|nr:unnamed protein product [Ananas comosus var. bracteatus]